MISRRHARTRAPQAANPDVDGALEAMTAPELRSFVRGVLDGLEDDQRAVIVDSLVTRAARGDAGRKPSRPSRRIVDEVRLFVEAARRIGHADPVRWLVADGHVPTVLRAKAKKALARCPRPGRQLGLLRVLVGDIGADLLSKAAGLGWSGEDHPGHVLFPSFAVLLANGTPRKVSDTLLADLESTCRDPLEAFSPDEVGGKPKLATPSIVALIQDVRSSIRLNEADRDAMRTAMRIAAERRVEGILGNSRRL